MNLLLILLGKLVLFLSRTLNLGSGSTWPGHIAMETNSKFIREVLKGNTDLKIVIVSGTNGKTTTSLMLRKILEEAGFKVFQNEAGANLLNGIASSIIKNLNLTGRLNFDVAIFEVDENNVRPALKEILPHAILILNIFRDQLDRYGEVNKVVKDWESALLNQDKTKLFTNGDDPQLTFIARNSKHEAYLFGIDEKFMEKKDIPHDVDFIYCPICQSKLTYEKISYSHMGKFSCSNCGFRRENIKSINNLPYHLLGKYNIYNVDAAALVANKAFGISEGKIRAAIKKFKPAFGRQEIIKYKSRDVLILLSKNPAGFNQSIGALLARSPLARAPRNIAGFNILLVLNDRIPDGRDISWIWDVDTEELFKIARNIFISGDRCYDMALRIKYSSSSEFHPPNGRIKFQIESNLKQAINNAVKETKFNETLLVLPTYSAMLEVRKLLLGRKIL